MTDPTGILSPAYGRDYQSLESAQADFDRDDLFQFNSVLGFSYTSIRDFTGKGKIQVTYDRLTKVGFLTYDR